MNEDILKLIQTLYTEFYSWKSKLEQTKALESENIFDAKLKSNIASIEERMAEIKQFIKNLEDSYQEILNKSYEDTTEESITQIDILEIKEDSVQAVIALQNTMNDIISKNITIEKLAFEHAKKCIDSLNLNPEIGNDLVAYIFDRIIKEATDFILTAFPFANEIIQIAQAIYSNSEIKIP
jgi:enoyl-[acyl-carrier-protein] reductase (NADH)